MQAGHTNFLFYLDPPNSEQGAGSAVLFKCALLTRRVLCACSLTVGNETIKQLPTASIRVNPSNVTKALLRLNFSSSDWITHLKVFTCLCYLSLHLIITMDAKCFGKYVLKIIFNYRLNFWSVTEFYNKLLL